MDFKDNFKQLRQSKGLSTTEVAARFDKSEAAVRAWESGRTKPDVNTLIELANFFNCTTDFLLGLSKYKNTDDKNKHFKELDELNNILSEMPNAKQELLLSAFYIMSMSLWRVINDIDNYESITDKEEVLSDIFYLGVGVISCTADVIKAIDETLDETPGINNLLSASYSANSAQKFISNLMGYILDRGNNQAEQAENKGE